MVCQVDNILRKLKALFAAGDPFAAEKATETWQKYEPILQKETVAEIDLTSLTSLPVPDDQCGTLTQKDRKNEVPKINVVNTITLDVKLHQMCFFF